jgi:hypothetical protein
MKTVEQYREEIEPKQPHCFHQRECPVIVETVYRALSIFLDQTRDDCPKCASRGWWLLRNESHKEDEGDTIRTICVLCHGTGKVGDWHPERLVVKK